MERSSINEGNVEIDRKTPVGVRITGVGAEIPPRVATTAELEEQADIGRFGFEPGWLERVTAVTERRWAEPDVTPSDLAAAAARTALADAGREPGDIDTVIFAGITKDYIEPAAANLVADAVGATQARVFDVMNACNGFIDGIDLADSLIRCGKARRVLVTTGERASIATWYRAPTVEEFIRTLASYMVSDGGGATVIEATDDPGRGFREREYRSFPTEWRHAIGGRLLPTDERCTSCGSLVDPRFLVDGRRMFEFGVSRLPHVVGAVMVRSGWSFEDVDFIFTHEVHKRFIDELGGVGGPLAKIWSTVGRFGNTSTVSLPLAMSEANAAGKLVAGRKVLLVGSCSGMSMAALTMVW
jgi:3-oxoacyl-[acyl-carrier-protein] synthase III